MNTSFLKIANAQAFWGDRSDAAFELVTSNPEIDYITFDYLAEISLSIMAIQRTKNPDAGYAKDFLSVIHSLIPYWQAGGKAKLISNAGGLNTKGCAEACAKILKEAGLKSLRVGYVYGDNVLEILQNDPENPLYSQLDTSQNLKTVANQLVSANAYAGAEAIVESLKMGAHIVVTGRVADPSITVAPCIFHYGWSWTDYDRLAGATIAGHLIECGTQVTGGISTHWLNLEHQQHIGFPIVEIDAEGRCIVTKAKDSGGEVTIETVKEQLLYEIGDPARYLSPDVEVSFLSLDLSENGKNRVLVTGAKGNKPPETLKVSACYPNGFRSEGTLALFGEKAITKARICSEIVKERLSNQGLMPSRFQVDIIGEGNVVPGIGRSNIESKETILRMAAADSDEKKLDAFAKEFAPLVTSGPQGLTGYTSGRPQIRPIYSYWPCLIKRTQVHMKTALVENFNE